MDLDDMRAAESDTGPVDSSVSIVGLIVDIVDSIADIEASRLVHKTIVEPLVGEKSVVSSIGTQTLLLRVLRCLSRNQNFVIL